jgi:hypothetical protein
MSWKEQVFLKFFVYSVYIYFIFSENGRNLSLPQLLTAFTLAPLVPNLYHRMSDPYCSEVSCCVVEGLYTVWESTFCSLMPKFGQNDGKYTFSLYMHDSKHNHYDKSNKHVYSVLNLSMYCMYAKSLFILS